MKAVIIKEVGKAELVDIKRQSMRPDYIKIKTVAVAVNPSTSCYKVFVSDNQCATADFPSHHGCGPRGWNIG